MNVYAGVMAPVTAKSYRTKEAGRSGFGSLREEVSGEASEASPLSCSCVTNTPLKLAPAAELMTGKQMPSQPAAKVDAFVYFV